MKVDGKEVEQISEKKRDIKREFKKSPGNYKMLSTQKISEEKAPELQERKVLSLDKFTDLQIDERIK